MNVDVDMNVNVNVDENVNVNVNEARRLGKAAWKLEGLTISATFDAVSK